jgi:aspartate racemase
MRTIGLIGGMSWKSSLEYYKLMNELIHDKLGGWHSAKIIMYSLDFDEIDLEHHTKDWKKSDEILFNAAKALEKSGADCIVIGANTAHILADKIQEKIKIPVLHITDATAEQIKNKKINSVGLLGTKLTMQENFYKGRLERKHNIKVLVPETSDQEKINAKINNIILGKENPKAKKEIITIIDKLVKKGAKAIILGCTELPLIVNQSDVKVLLFDTMKIHAEKAVTYSLK